MTEQEPMYSCRHPGCAEEFSYNADMLRHHPSGGLVCETCWQHEDGADWNELPEVVSHKERCAALEAELDHFKKSGIIEVATRNPSVKDYMDHWESRAATAESALAAMTAERDELAAQLGAAKSFMERALRDAADPRRFNPKADAAQTLRFALNSNWPARAKAMGDVVKAAQAETKAEEEDASYHEQSAGSLSSKSGNARRQRRAAVRALTHIDKQEQSDG